MLQFRVEAQMNNIGYANGCTAFRAFQGWLSMSNSGPGTGTLKVLPTRPQCTSQEAKPQKPQLVTTRLFDRTLLSSPLPKDKWLWKRWGGVEKMYLYICVFVYLCKSCERGDEELRKWNDSYETLNLQSPSPALHDLPSPDLTSANPVVKRQPQQKFFPAQAKRWWG